MGGRHRVHGRAPRSLMSRPSARITRARGYRTRFTATMAAAPRMAQPPATEYRARRSCRPPGWRERRRGRRTGYGVMLAWVAVLLAVAAVLLRRRDA